MFAQFQTVTPKMATEWLSKNHSNRGVSKDTVRQYASDMVRGKWGKSHQGILLGKNGNLIDGQHRLMAVVSADVPVEMLVVIDESFESALMSNIDMGRKRHAAVSLGIPAIDASICTFLLRVGKNIASPSSSEILEIYQRVSKFIDPMTNNKMKGITTPVHTAVVYWQWKAPEHSEWVLSTFQSMLLKKECRNIDPLPWSLYQQLVIDRISYTQHETLARAIKAFDYNHRMTSKLQFKDVSAAMSAATIAIQEMVADLTQ